MEEAVKNLTLLVVSAAAIVLSAAFFGATAQTASAHRSGCHSQHQCPSDHATYRWSAKRLLCVKPSSDKRTPSFTIRDSYAGLPYLCKR